MQPLTPNQLLLGRNNAEIPSMSYDESSRFSARVSFVENVHKEWWSRWIAEVLPTLIPCRRWKSRHRNLKKGDIVMLNYKGNLVDDYRLARIAEVYPDKRNLVRSVDIMFRKSDSREPLEVYRSKPLVMERVGVQRLSLIQPVDEDLYDGVEDT